MNRVMPWLPAFLALSTSVAVLEPRADRPALVPAGGVRRMAAHRHPGSLRRRGRVRALRRAARRRRRGDATRATCGGRSVRRALSRRSSCASATRARASPTRVAIAVLYRCLSGCSCAVPSSRAAWTPFTRRLIDENRWRAKRHGLDAEFVASDGSPPVPCRTAIEQLLDEVAEDAHALGLRGTARSASARCWTKARARTRSSGSSSAPRGRATRPRRRCSSSSTGWSRRRWPKARYRRTRPASLRWPTNLRRPRPAGSPAAARRPSRPSATR